MFVRDLLLSVAAQSRRYDFAELRDAIPAVLDAITLPNVYNYFVLEYRAYHRHEAME